MVKMKKWFDADDNGDDDNGDNGDDDNGDDDNGDDGNGDDDNGTDVKLKRAFKKSDCAGTQGAAAPSPSAQLSRIQPLQLPLLQPLLLPLLQGKQHPLLQLTRSPTNTTTNTYVQSIKTTKTKTTTMYFHC